MAKKSLGQELLSKSLKVEVSGSAEKGFTVQAVGPKRDDYREYRGPCLQVDYDSTWLYLVTDNYEGSAMINIETLPAIIKVLRAIDKRRKELPSKKATPAQNKNAPLLKRERRETR